MTRPLVDTAEILARVEGRTDRTAARMLGIADKTLRRWRNTGTGDPTAVAQAMQRIDSNPTDPTKPNGRPPGPTPVEVHCTKTSEGWIVDAYLAGTNSPIEALACAARRGQRWPTLEEAHRFARRRFGDRLAVITPELDA